MHKMTILIIAACAVSAQIPVFNYTNKEMNEDLYNQKMVFAAAETCGIDTNVDYLEMHINVGYTFIKVLNWKGNFKILKKNSVDAGWDNGKLYMYGCLGEEYDTIYKIDTFPPYTLHVKDLSNDNEIAELYKNMKEHLYKNKMKEYEIWTIKKVRDTLYEIEAVKKWGFCKFELKKNKNKCLIETKDCGLF